MLRGGLGVVSNFAVSRHELFPRRGSCLGHQEPKDRRAKQAHRRNTQKCCRAAKTHSYQAKECGAERSTDSGRKMTATGSAQNRERTIRDRDDIIVRAQVKRGNIYSQQGRDEAALAEYGQALELRPDDGWIYVNRGWLHENQGRLDLARADYEKAASLTPPDDWLKRALERTR